MQAGGGQRIGPGPRPGPAAGAFSALSVAECTAAGPLHARSVPCRPAAFTATEGDREVFVDSSRCAGATARSRPSRRRWDRLCGVAFHSATR